jgi:hypothetical protein
MRLTSLQVLASLPGCEVVAVAGGVVEVGDELSGESGALSLVDSC